jgi:hypothetical protein
MGRQRGKMGRRSTSVELSVEVGSVGSCGTEYLRRGARRR